MMVGALEHTNHSENDALKTQLRVLNLYACFGVIKFDEKSQGKIFFQGKIEITQTDKRKGDRRQAGRSPKRNFQRTDA